MGSTSALRGSIDIDWSCESEQRCEIKSRRRRQQRQIWAECSKNTFGKIFGPTNRDGPVPTYFTRFLCFSNGSPVDGMELACRTEAIRGAITRRANGRTTATALEHSKRKRIRTCAGLSGFRANIGGPFVAREWLEVPASICSLCSSNVGSANEIATCKTAAERVTRRADDYARFR